MYLFGWGLLYKEGCISLFEYFCRAQAVHLRLGHLLDFYDNGRCLSVPLPFAVSRRWLATTALENAREFNLIGKVFGLAIYNSVILDVHFPMVCAHLALSRRLTAVVRARLLSCLSLAMRSLEHTVASYMHCMCLGAIQEAHESVCM